MSAKTFQANIKQFNARAQVDETYKRIQMYYYYSCQSLQSTWVQEEI